MSPAARPCSEVLAAEAVSCLNKALCHLKDIWEEIGIPEDQRLQRCNVVKNHIKVSHRTSNDKGVNMWRNLLSKLFD